MPRIEIEINKNGEIRAEGFDFEGDSCEDAILNALKDVGEISDIRDKIEYHGKRRVNKNIERKV